VSVGQRIRRAWPALVHQGLAAAQARGYQPQKPWTRLDQLYGRADLAAFAAVADFTMTPPNRIAVLRDAVSYLVRAGIPGDFVECGVWRGGSMMAIAGALLEARDRTRDLWLFDTFAAGMTDPGPEDRTYDGRDAQCWIAAGRPEDTATPGVFGVPMTQVRANLDSTGYPRDQIRLVEGPVEQTLTGDKPDRIAMLRLDTDFYASTQAELAELYPRLSPGGVLILDDYGYWQGARQAVDEYFAGQPVLFVRVDASARLVIKPGG
jgi:O-methyltransferase